MNERVLRVLRKFMSASDFERLIEYAKRSRRGGSCPACGKSPMRGDYVCASCSTLKVEHPRRFFHAVLEREGVLRDETGAWLSRGTAVASPIEVSLGREA